MRSRMPLRVRRLVLVAVVVACASVPATAVAAGAPATASVIVYRCGADFANLCRLDPLSRHHQPLTSDGNQSMAYQSPSLSRDGRHLAFVFNQQVYWATRTRPSASPSRERKARGTRICAPMPRRSAFSAFA
jgi:hypothetical protein